MCMSCHPRLNPTQIAEMVQAHREGARPCDLARKYGVSVATVHNHVAVKSTAPISYPIDYASKRWPELTSFKRRQSHREMDSRKHDLYGE
jgi:hypothetical protein